MRAHPWTRGAHGVGRGRGLGRRQRRAARVLRTWGRRTLLIGGTPAACAPRSRAGRRRARLLGTPRAPSSTSTSSPSESKTNVPVVMALLRHLEREPLGLGARASCRTRSLSALAAHVQQLEMESHGRSATMTAAAASAGEIVIGGPAERPTLLFRRCAPGQAVPTAASGSAAPRSAAFRERAHGRRVGRRPPSKGFFAQRRTRSPSAARLRDDHLGDAPWARERRLHLGELPAPPTRRAPAPLTLLLDKLARSTSARCSGRGHRCAVQGFVWDRKPSTSGACSSPQLAAQHPCARAPRPRRAARDPRRGRACLYLGGAAGRTRHGGRRVRGRSRTDSARAPWTALKRTVRTRRGVEPAGRPARREVERGRRARTNSSRTFAQRAAAAARGAGAAAAVPPSWHLRRSR